MTNPISKLALIIDDDHDSINMYRLLIEAGIPGVSSLITSNGADGIKLAYQHKPDIILSDLMMPAPNGFEICKSVREYAKTKHIPILIITGVDDRETRFEALEAGASEVMTKPFDPQKLVESVKNILRGAELGIYDE